MGLYAGFIPIWARFAPTTCLQLLGIVGAVWLREASYLLLFASVSPIKDLMGVKKDSNFLLKFTAGSLAGAIGSTAGNPFDVLKTRMMATEGLKTPALMDSARELYKAQGMGGFYRGLQANVARAMVLNGTKMGVYDQISGMIKHSGVVPKGLPTQFTAAFCAGFFMACTVSPFDMIRTRLMNQPPDAKIYNGFVDCAAKLFKENGTKGFYAGFIPIGARFAPTTCLQFIFFEHFVCTYVGVSALFAPWSWTTGNPFDVLQTRVMATEGTAASSMIQAATAQYRGQGIAGFYRGIQANVMRAMVLNGTSMACYDQISKLIKESGLVPSCIPTQFCASFGAGFFMACTVTPFDVLRT
eukprot:gene35034-43201_t